MLPTQPTAPDIDIDYGETFAGLGLAGLAIENVFPKSKCVYYSEIEKNRCNLLAKRHPNAKNIGDIDFLDTDKLPRVRLLVGGSPCQNLSIANTNTREGLDGHESELFYQYLEIIREKKPEFFLLENVASMSDEDRNEISRCLGVQPVMINSIYFTGQIRKRYYWCNWPILPYDTTPVDPRHCIDKSVIPDRPTSDFIDVKELYSAYTPRGKMKDPKSLAKGKSDWDFVAWSRSTRYKTFADELDENGKVIKMREELFSKWRESNPQNIKISHTKNNEIKISYVEQRIKINMQANTLLTGPGCSIFSSRNFIRHGDKMRMLTPLECARLQGIPDGHMEGWSVRAAEGAIGDAFTLNVIKHIMKSLRFYIEQNNNMGA